MNDLIFEKITPEGADAVHELLTLCGRDLATRHGFRNWDPPAPLHVIRQDALEREVYLFRSAGATIATITLGRTASIPYGEDVPRFSGPSPAVYVNRLAVHPSVQGHGYGRFCMRFAEERARDMGAKAVRCDVLADNARLRAFYEELGYLVMGGRDHSGWHFVCYEKEL